MIVTPWERRAAEQFNNLLEAEHPPAHDEFSPLLMLGERTRALGDEIQIDPAFRDRFRTRLLAVAAVQGVGRKNHTPEETASKTPAHTKRFAPRRVALVSGTLAALVGLSGVGLASTGANPGDALYGIKRSREAAQLALAQSDVSRGELHLQFAKTRLKEAEKIHDDRGELARALDDMDADTRSGMLELSGAAVQRRSTAPLETVDSFTASQRHGLASLINRLRVDSRQRALDSLGVIEQVDSRANALRPSLLCTADYSGTGRSDELGPVPRTCSALQEQPGAAKPGPAGPGSLTPTASPSGKPSASASGDNPLASHSDGLLANPNGNAQLPGIQQSARPAKDGTGNGVLGLLGGVIGAVIDAGK